MFSYISQEHPKMFFGKNKFVHVTLTNCYYVSGRNQNKQQKSLHFYSNEGEYSMGDTK